jgi:Tol biopolymer transport system component
LDGAIAFERVVGTNSDIYTISPNGGRLRRLTIAPGSDFAPSWSTSGRIAFVSDRLGSFELFTMTARGAAERPLTRSGQPVNKSGPDWAPDGRRIALAAGRVRRADIYLLTIGSSKLLNATRNINTDDTSPSWSPDGSEFVFSRTRGRATHLYRYLVTSRKTVVLTRGSGLDSDPAWSPDGQRIAFTRRDTSGNYDVWVIDLASGDELRLTSGPAQDRNPTWSPDGTAIAFVTNRDAAEDYEIYVMGANGSGPTNITRSPRTIDLAPDWSNVSVRPASLISASRTPQFAADACDLSGTDGNDDLIGNETDQVICGLGGDDTIRGGGGRDRIAGGAGDDAIYGQRGGDVIQGMAGKDKLYGGRGADVFYAAGGGKDMIDGGPSKLDRCGLCDVGDAKVNVELESP